MHRWLPRLSQDGWLLFATCAVRMFAYGFLSVILGLYLASLGMNLAAIGAIFTVALVGGAVMTVFLTQTADRLGRKRVLLVGGGLMAAAGAVFAITDQPLLLFGAAIIGTISPSGKEVGPFSRSSKRSCPKPLAMSNAPTSSPPTTSSARCQARSGPWPRDCPRSLA